jgi:hypothetical protein
MAYATTRTPSNHDTTNDVCALDHAMILGWRISLPPRVMYLLRLLGLGCLT